jgi:hypothetical protein
MSWHDIPPKPFSVLAMQRLATLAPASRYRWGHHHPLPLQVL